MFTNSFDSTAQPARGAPSTTLRLEALLQPRMGRFSLRFHDPALELDYREASARQSMLVVRFGVVLTMLVYVLFGLLDLTAAAAVAAPWPLTPTVVLGMGAVFACSFLPAFIRYRERIMAAFTILLGCGLLVLFLGTADAALNRHLVALLLLTIGAFSVMGLRFLDALLVATGLVVVYLVAGPPVHGPAVAANATFLLSTLIIAASGGYMAERQRRLAHCRRRVIERAREANRHDALHDPLTGLPNRRLLMERLNQALARDGRFETCAAVLFIDIDDFKPINDTHGHVFGDQLLREIAGRLLRQVRLTDTVARLGGDEFVVLLEDLVDAWTATMLKERIIESFCTPFEIEGVSVPVRVSIGMALHPVDASEPRLLLEAADGDMYRMKQEKYGAGDLRRLR